MKTNNEHHIWIKDSPLHPRRTKIEDSNIRNEASTHGGLVNQVRALVHVRPLRVGQMRPRRGDIAAWMAALEGDHGRRGRGARHVDEVHVVDGERRRVGFAFGWKGRGGL